MRNKRMSTPTKYDELQSQKKSVSEQEEPKLFNKLKRDKKIVATLLLIIIIMFGADVIVESYMNYDAKFGITEDQSKVCFVQFINKKCSISALTNDCDEILDCVQKEKKLSIREVAYFLLETINSEIIENYQFPSIAAACLLLLFVGLEMQTTLHRIKNQ